MDQSLQDELQELIESSLSIATLSDDNQAALKKRLLALPEDEMRRVVEVLRGEQKQQYEAMKGLVQKIENASTTLKKTFLKEREKEETKQSDQKADQLIKKLDDMD